MEVIVREVDAYAIGTQLQSLGYRSKPQLDIFTIDARTGRCEAQKTFQPVLVRTCSSGHPGHDDLSVEIFIGDPGERCVRIVGDPHMVFNTLWDVRLPSASLADKKREMETKNRA